MSAPVSSGDRRRYALSGLTGEFINSTQEANFRAGIRPVWLLRARTIIVVGLFAHLITSVIDYVLLGLTPAFYILVGARLVVTAQGLTYLWAVGRNRSTRVWDFGMLLFLVLLVTAFLSMVALRPDGPRVTAPAAILVLCVFYMVPMTRLWVSALSALYLSLGLAVVGNAVSVGSDPPLIVIGIQLLTANLIGYFVCLRMHQDARHAWINQQSLERNERHQRILANLSSQFLGLRSEQIDEAIHQALNAIGGYTTSDRAYLMEFDQARETARMTHEWCASDIPSTKASMQNVSSGLMPWSSLKMQRGEIVQADRVSDLPPEASAERDLNLAQGVQSFLCVPLSHEGLLLGMIGLDRVRCQRAWEADTVEFLRFVGQAIFNTLHRSRAEENLRAREAQLQTLTTLSPVGIFQTDADGYCQYSNERWLEMTGLHKDAAMGSRWRQALHPDDAERVFASWNAAVTGKTEFEDEYRYRRPDGSVVWVHGRARPQFHADGRLLGFIGTVDDITERKRSQVELEQRAHLDEFVAKLTIQFVRQDSSDLNDVIRRGLADIGQYTGADHCRLFLFDWNTQTKSCVHEWSVAGVEPQIQHLQNIPIADSEWACPLILRGEIVNVPDIAKLPSEAMSERALYQQMGFQSMLLVPIVSGGRVAGFVGLDRMTTAREWSSDTVLLLRIAGETFISALQRQQVEQAQQQRAQALENLNLDLERRNVEQQRLAYVASHDLKEPLRTVSSFSSLLAQNYLGRLDERADEYIGYITAASTRLHSLINDLLTYTRTDLQPRAPVDCDMNEIAQVVLANLSETTRALGAHIDCGNLPTLNAEPLQMIHLLQHLVANALRFHGAEPPRIAICAERREMEWVLSVSDNGIGIAPEHAERVFEIFQRLHNNEQYPGTGIGLPVCRRIVERHGGRIWVEPNQPQGCVFRWTLPVVISAETGQSVESRHAA